MVRWFKILVLDVQLQNKDNSSHDVEKIFSIKYSVYVLNPKLKTPYF